MCHRRRSARCAWAGAACVILIGLFAAPAARAQVPRLDDLPWTAVADTASRRALTVSADRSWDNLTHWTASRLGLMATLPAGREGAVFLRVHLVHFDRDDLPALERWPQVAGESTADDPTWPRARYITSWGQMQIGIVMPARLPLVGHARMGILVGLPVGKEELYPFGSTSLPLVLDLRRGWRVTPAVEIALRAGIESTLDAAGDALAPDAFPDGHRFGAEAIWEPRTGRSFHVSFLERSFGGHATRRITAACWFPLHTRHMCGVAYTRDLGERSDRAGTDEVAVFWRFAGTPPAPPSAQRR